MNEINFKNEHEIVLDKDNETMSSKEMAIYRDRFFDMAKLFDRPGQKVISELPSALKLREVIGIQNHPDKTTKITFRRFQVLYLCWVPTTDAIDSLNRLKEEVSERDEWDERWEPWELYGSTEPRELQKRIIGSRLRNEKERTEFEKYY